VTGAQGIVKRVKCQASISSIAFARHSLILPASTRRKSWLRALSWVDILYPEHLQGCRICWQGVTL